MLLFSSCGKTSINNDTCQHKYCDNSPESALNTRLYELSFDYITHLIFDWGEHIETSCFIDMPPFHCNIHQLFALRLWNTFKTDVYLFLNAVNSDIRSGRNAIIITTDLLFTGTIDRGDELYFVAWLEMLRFTLPENYPSTTYAVDVLNDARIMGSCLQQPSFYLFQSRIFHIFLSDLQIFFEASSIFNTMIKDYYEIYCDKFIDWLFNYVMRNIVDIKVMNHPIYTTTITSYIESSFCIQFDSEVRLFKDNFIDTLHDTWGAQLEIIASFYREPTPVDIEFQYIRNILHPDENWIDDFDWLSIRGGGMLSSVFEFLELRAGFSISCLWVLFFSDLFNEFTISSPIPTCPLWQLSAISNPARSIMITHITLHLLDLRDGGFIIYQNIIDILTDTTRIFDTRTKETFTMISLLFEEHGLFQS